MHVQIVLCPGVNDGAVLRETVDWQLRASLEPLEHDAGAAPTTTTPPTTTLADDVGADVSGGGVRGGVIDVGVVPVSLAHAGGDLRRVTPADAAAVLALVGEAQAAAVAAVGRRFVHAADELYLATGALPPAGDAPAQYENGIGICAALLADADELDDRPREPAGGPARRRGVGAGPGRGRRRLTARTGAAVRPFVVDNALFGAARHGDRAARRPRGRGRSARAAARRRRVAARAAHRSCRPSWGAPSTT